jgi:hypothetical protein
VLHADSKDAGRSWHLPDASDKPVWSRDGRGYESRTSFDELHRPTARTVTPPSGPAFISEKWLYGESRNRNDAIAANQLGRLYQSYDQAGIVTHRYDFKGNVVETRRELLRNYGHETDPNAAPERQVADWSAQPAYAAPQLTDFGALTTSTTYDALNRPVVVTLPARDPTLGAGIEPPPNQMGADSGACPRT